MSNKELIIDGSGMILGRLASIVAKKLLEGYRVYVVNSEKIAVSGDPARLKQFYKRTILGVKSHYSHRLRPKRPRSPARLFKHAVRGMLPKDNRRGKDALKRLKVYVGVPEELSGREIITFSDASVNRLSRGYLELGVIAKELGWKGEE